MAELARLSLAEIPNDLWVSAARKKVCDALKDDPSGQWGKLKLPLLGEKVRAEIDRALADIDPMTLFAQAWIKVREIRKLPRDKTCFVEIGEHMFKKDLHPLLTVTFDPWVSEQIKFTLTLRAEINAVEIEVRNRHIVAAGGGSCNLGVELKYGTASLSGPIEFKRYDLPGEYRFKGDGIPIPGGDDDAASPAPEHLP